MFHDKKNKSIPKGDYVTANEAVMDPLSEIRSRCESVHDVTSQGILPLSKALKAYKVTFEQYVIFLISNKEKRKIPVDIGTIAAFVQLMFSYMDTYKTHLDDRSKKIVVDMRQLSTVK